MLELNLLGTPQILRAGQHVTFDAAKPIALLAYLALNPTPQPRERLLGLLWADSAEDAARKNLRNTLWRMRRALGNDIIHIANDKLALNPLIDVDIRRFEQLSADAERLSGSTQAVAMEALHQSLQKLWRGPLLDGLEVPDALEFEHWLLAERERLQRAYLQMLHRSIQVSQANGDWASVIATSRLVVAHDPLQEQAYRFLMEALARRGERTAALHQYEQLRVTLARELGIAPLPETEALRRVIMRGAIGGGFVSSVMLASPQVETPLADRPAFLPLIGRQAELGVLDAALARAQAGHAQVAVLSGPMGIGKTRLWQAWSSQLAADTLVLAARGSESLSGLSLLPVTELIRNTPRATQLLGPQSPLAASWLAELGRLLAEIRAARSDLPPLATESAAERQTALFEALVQLLDLLSGAACVIWIDDLHWADTATLDWLLYLLRRRPTKPLLLVASYRPEDASEALLSLLAQWSRDGIAHKLRLGPLGNDEAAALLASTASEPAARAWALAEGAGNPYVLLELARGDAGIIPTDLADIVRRRLNRLPDPAHQLLRAALVLQPAIDGALLRWMSGGSEEETLDALDLLLRTGMLEERDDHYIIGQPLVASVIRMDLSAARRAFLHRRAAEAAAAQMALDEAQLRLDIAAYPALRAHAATHSRRRA